MTRFCVLCRDLGRASGSHMNTDGNVESNAILYAHTLDFKENARLDGN